MSFAQVTAVLQKNCVVCHGPMATPALIQSDSLYSTLTTTSISPCNGDSLVTPGDVASSALVSVLTGKCGQLKMPFGCDTTPCIPQADVDLISAWIEHGAPER